MSQQMDQWRQAQVARNDGAQPAQTVQGLGSGGVGFRVQRHSHSQDQAHQEATTRNVGSNLFGMKNQ